jgi:hypothetical protein
MADIKIQRGTFTFGATEDSDTTTITAVGSLTNAFARITGVINTAASNASGTGGSKNCDDVGATCLLTATDTITFTRVSTGENVDIQVYWEVWEYTGSASGANEFLVRHHGNIASIATSTDTTLDTTASTAGDCVPFICGVISTNTGKDFPDCQVVGAEVTSTTNVRIHRDTATSTTTISIAVVEFTGSNWSVQNNITHAFSAAGANETETITTVTNTATAFVVSGRSGTNTTGLDETGWNVWFKDADELYFRMRSGATVAGSTAYAHVVKHADMVVDHTDSITGGGTDLPVGSGQPQTENRTVATQTATSTSAVVATADCAGTGTAHPRAHWLYRLTSTTNVEFWRSRDGQAGDWALQVIDFDAVGGGDKTVTPSVLTATASVQAPKLTDAEVYIQRGQIVFGASEDSTTATIASVNTANAFARVTASRFSSGGPDAGTSTDRNNDDLGVTCLLTDSTTVTVTRPSTGVNEDIRVEFEVWEYIGAASGANEFIVREHSNVSVSGVSSVSTTVSGITTLADCVPFICGVSSDATTNDWQRASFSAKMESSPSNQVTLYRNATFYDADVSIAVVEFTGSNWTVENNVTHSYSAAATNETETITAVTLAESFVVYSSQIDDSNYDEAECSAVVWFKDTDELYFRTEQATSLTNNETVAHVVSNSQLSVEHIDSITGSETDHGTGANPHSVDETITAVTRLNAAAVVAGHTGGYGFSDDYGSDFWNYKLTSTTNLNWWRARGTYTSDNWAAQIIDFSDVKDNPDITASPSVLTATASVQAPTISAEQNVTVTPSVLTATASVQAPTPEVDILPSTLTATSGVQAPTVSGTANVSVSEQTATASVQAPSVSGDANVSVTELTATASVQAPSIDIGDSVAPSVLTVTTSVQAPTVVIDATVSRSRS